MFVKPKDGLGYPVLDPVTQAELPPEGKEITSNERWWLRRIAEGDVVEIDAAAAKVEAAKIEAAARIDAAKAEAAAKVAPATKQGAA